MHLRHGTSLRSSPWPFWTCIFTSGKKNVASWNNLALPPNFEFKNSKKTPLTSNMYHKIVQISFMFFLFKTSLKNCQTIVAFQKFERKNTTLKFWIKMPWSSTIFLPFFSLIRFWIFFRNDFYLVPMSVNLGTVNPTHYIVTDAGSIEIDLIQKVAYALSHMYFNWTGTVKIPAPCQYARKLGKWKKAIFLFPKLFRPTARKKI